MKRYIFLCVWLCLFAFSGCSGLQPQELYCLPEAPETYYDLQEALNQELSGGLAYHAPASGTRREPVQLVDLNGDGLEEAVAFFRSTTDGALKTYIFENRDGVYETAAVIDCAGSAVASVEYADLTGKGDLELMISCQVSETVSGALQVCRYTEGTAVTLATIPCSRFHLSDLDRNWAQELLCFVDNGSENGSVTYHLLKEEQLTARNSLKLSASYGSILKIEDMTLCDGTKAVAVTSAYGENQTVYDILMLQEEGLAALKRDGALLLCDNPRGGVLYPQDMDGDGQKELPWIQPLPDGQDGIYPLTGWYDLTGAGEMTLSALTYQDFSNNWNLALPMGWADQVLVRQSDTSDAAVTVSAANFCEYDSEEPLLTIYTLRGSGAQSFVEEQELNILYSDTEITYAAALSADAAEITMKEISEGFTTKEKN